MSNQTSNYNEENLLDLLPLYYQRLFPYKLMTKWLSYGESKYFGNREFSFTLPGDIYIRYLSFDTADEFLQTLKLRNPVKIDIGAVYNEKPKNKRRFHRFYPVEKEVVFDIDLTDYDEVRTCCSGTDVCTKCWKFIVFACKILETSLREDFDFKHLLWVFSGRRGVHCWVCDSVMRKSNEWERPAVPEYFHIVKGGAYQFKKVSLPYERIHTCLQRDLKIIEEHFMDYIVVGQDILGTPERVQHFLKIIDEEHKGKFLDVLMQGKSSAERWLIFEKQLKNLLQKNELPRNLRNLREEIMLQYAYPRLDINVSTGVNHLLKAPFSVHPKTGRISVPFSAKAVEKFDPNAIPTINVLVDEINAYDAKTKQQEQSLTEKDLEEGFTNIIKIKDYKKTSLLKPISLFEKFLREFEKNRNDGQRMEF